MIVKNEAKRNGPGIRKLRNFFEHRALWLYFLYDEAKKSGINPESFAPKAIRRCGIYHGIRALTGKDEEVKSSVINNTAGGKEGSCRMLCKKLFTPVGRKVFEMKFLRLDNDAFDVDFHYCPLVAAWQKQGCSGGEIDKLCDLAMEGDRGIADAFGCELELKKTIAKGDGVCQIRFKRKNNN